MKKITLLLSLSFMLISAYTADAQCTITGNLDFRSQTDIDNWVPPCSQITVNGFVNVQGATITNISKLANIVQIGSFLQLRTISASVTNINALSNITSIGAGITIRDCDGLTSIAPLAGVTTFAGPLTVRDNLALTSLDGLQNLGTTVGAITIFNNTALADINAINYGPLNSLLEINTNPALTSLGTLSAITSVNGLLKISTNASLANISGLSALKTVAGNVEITANNSLTDISGLSSLTFAGGGLFIRTNPLLPNLTGLKKLVQIGSALDVKDNVLLKSLCGLNALVASNTFTSYVVTGNGYNPLVSDFPANCQDPTLSTANFKSFGFSSYPNPVRNQLNIEVDRDVSYVISNINGQKVMVGSLVNGENSIITSELTSGMYIIEISDLSGLKYSAKILKE